MASGGCVAEPNSGLGEAITYMRKSRNGARVGDLFMSLIHTCELNKVNPFDYITELQKHASELSSEPDSWMPWNYRDMLEARETSIKTDDLRPKPAKHPNKFRFFPLCRKDTLLLVGSKVIHFPFEVVPHDIGEE